MSEENLNLITVIVQHKAEGRVIDAMLELRTTAGVLLPDPAAVPESPGAAGSASSSSPLSDVSNASISACDRISDKTRPPALARSIARPICGCQFVIGNPGIFFRV